MDIDLLIDSVFKRPPIWDKKDKLHGNRNFVDKCWKQISAEMNQDELKLRKKWKYLRDQFSVELGKMLPTPLGAATNNQNPKWPHFQQLLFLEHVVTPRAPVGSTSRAIEYYDEFDIRTFHPDPIESSRRMRSCVEQNDGRIDNFYGYKSNDSIQTTDNSPTKTKKPKKSRDSSSWQNDDDSDEHESHVENVDDYESNEQPTESSTSKTKKRKKSKDSVPRKKSTESDEHLLFFKSLLPHVRKIPQRKLLSFRSRIQQVVEEFVYNRKDRRDFDSFDVEGGSFGTGNSVKNESDSD